MPPSARSFSTNDRQHIRKPTFWRTAPSASRDVAVMHIAPGTIATMVKLFHPLRQARPCRIVALCLQMQEWHALQGHLRVLIGHSARIVRTCHRQEKIAEQFFAAPRISVFDPTVMCAKSKQNIASPIEAEQDIGVV